MADIAGAVNKMNDIEIAQDAPITEALFLKIGANINELVNALVPVGSIIHSALTEFEFNSEVGSSSVWIIADGRDVTGSKYASRTGRTTVPDLRGTFLRGKNNSRSDGKQDPDGERALLAYQADQAGPHTHTIGSAFGQADFGTGFNGDMFSSNSGAGGGTYTVNSNGTSETRPRNYAVNIFIRIN